MVIWWLDINVICHFTSFFYQFYIKKDVGDMLNMRNDLNVPLWVLSTLFGGRRIHFRGQNRRQLHLYQSFCCFIPKKCMKNSDWSHFELEWIHTMARGTYITNWMPQNSFLQVTGAERIYIKVFGCFFYEITIWNIKNDLFQGHDSNTPGATRAVQPRILPPGPAIPAGSLWYPLSWT